MRTVILVRIVGLRVAQSYGYRKPIFAMRTVILVRIVGLSVAQSYRLGVFMRVFLIIFGCFVAFNLIMMMIDSNRLVTRQYRIVSSKLRRCHRFVYLTDLHGKQFGKDDAKLVEKIRLAKPDFILIGGDMIVRADSDPDSTKWYDSVVSLIRQLAAEFPVFCVNGNHELRLEKPYPFDHFDGECYRIYTEQLCEAGARVSRNERIRLSDITGNSEDNDVELYSFEPDHCIYNKFVKHTINVAYVKERLGDKPEQGGFSLVLSHHPKHFDALAAWGADAVISGHCHGGCLRLPYIGGVISPDPELFPRYSGGMYVLNEENSAEGSGSTEDNANTEDHDIKCHGKRIFPKDNFLGLGRKFANGERDAGECRLASGTTSASSEKPDSSTPGDGHCSVMILSCGTGMHTIPARIFNPCEISVIELIPEKGTQ